MLNNIFLIIQTIFSVGLVILIFTQLRGSGIASGKSGYISFSRRGLDKFLFKLTFVFAFVLLTVSFLSLII